MIQVFKEEEKAEWKHDIEGRKRMKNKNGGKRKKWKKIYSMKKNEMMKIKKEKKAEWKKNKKIKFKEEKREIKKNKGRKIQRWYQRKEKNEKMILTKNNKKNDIETRTRTRTRRMKRYHST